MLEIPIGARLPSLKSLEIRLRSTGQWYSISRWLEHVLARLKEQGDLDGFDLLTISTVSGQVVANKIKDRVKDEIDTLLPQHKICFKTRSGDPYCPL